MKDKISHIQYLQSKGPYSLECKKIIFSNEEITLLEKYGYWFTGLEKGELFPFTELQKLFIQVAKKEREPVSFEEKTWFKYKARKAIEAKNGDAMEREYLIECDSFYSREMAKGMKSMMYKEMIKNHRT